MVQTGQLIVLVLMCVVSSRAEYTWTGTDWKWQNPVDIKETSQSGDSVGGGGLGRGGAVEGSGGQDSPFDDDEDTYDDDTYDYGDEEEEYNYSYHDNKENLAKSPKLQGPRDPSITSNRAPSLTPNSDDEDLTEGSGAEEEVEAEEEDTREGSGRIGSPIWKDEVVTSPPRRFQPTKVDPPPRNEVGKIPVEDYDDEETLYVDHVNYKGHTPRKEDVFFGGEEDQSKNWFEVTTTSTSSPATKKNQVPKPTEAPDVHRSGPTNNRPVSFFAQPGILAAVIGGAVVGLLCAILLVMFIVYRMRKKDEGSYALDEPKRAHNANSYSKPPSREFYA
jgi:hypothetical protein